MSQRLFDQLDRLERGARFETRPTRETYNESSADYSAFEDAQMNAEPQSDYYGGFEREHGSFVEEPLTLDAFGTWYLQTRRARLISHRRTAASPA